MDTLEERVERLEAREQIRQLVARHALAIDSRDLDELVALYAEDVMTPDGSIGRDALRSWFDSELRRYRTSFHLVGSHVIDLIDEDRATGSVYERAEHEVNDLWIVAAAQHRDDYARRDGRWYLTARSTHLFYAADVTEHPLRVPGRYHFPGQRTGTADLPESWPSWQRFWGAGPGIGAASGRRPDEAAP